MDGFYVAKFKVEKRKKSGSGENRDVEEEPQMMLNEEGELVEEDMGPASAFNEAEDMDLIDESKRKHLLRTKGIKVGKGKGVEKAKPGKGSKGKGRP
jgi:ribosomal RNA methyltransferase Nop2